jgi:hypothetical protein
VKITLITATVALLLGGSIALAQNASTGATTTSGDSAVSPAASKPVSAASGGDDRPTPGVGVNSGVLNNGTTGDTIGTGPGTTNRPSDGLGTSPAKGKE